MAEKNIDQQVAEKEAEITKLKTEQEKLRQKAAHQEYPKWIADPSDDSGAAGRTVATAEEEKAVLASYEKEFATAGKMKALAKKIADLEAAAAKEAADDAEKARLAAATVAKGKGKVK